MAKKEERHLTKEMSDLLYSLELHFGNDCITGWNDNLIEFHYKEDNDTSYASVLLERKQNEYEKWEWDVYSYGGLDVLYPDKADELLWVIGKKEKVCCICGKPLVNERYGDRYFGNNANPVFDGRCCDDCDNKFVIPARIGWVDIKNVPFLRYHLYINNVILPKEREEYYKNKKEI